jgi:hypothetical protein
VTTIPQGSDAPARATPPSDGADSGTGNASCGGSRSHSTVWQIVRLAEPTCFGSGDRRRRSDASYPHDPRWIAWNLWRAACSRRAEGRWPLCWPEEDCSADASGRDRGRQPAQKRADHDAAGDRPSPRQRSRPPQLHGRAAERVVGGRHHLPADVGRLSLPQGRSRRLVAPESSEGPSRPI